MSAWMLIPVFIHVVISQMNEYGFDKILKGLDFTQEQITYSKMLIAGRMVHPGSERETVRWLSETSGVGEQIGRASCRERV